MKLLGFIRQSTLQAMESTLASAKGCKHSPSHGSPLDSRWQHSMILLNLTVFLVADMPQQLCPCTSQGRGLAPTQSNTHSKSLQHLLCFKSTPYKVKNSVLLVPDTIY